MQALRLQTNTTVGLFIEKNEVTRGHFDMKCIFTILFLLTSNYSYAWSLLGPSTLEDCILENMKGVTSDDAALAIRVACMKKFPGDATKQCKMREMTSAEAKNVTALARMKEKYFISGLKMDVLVRPRTNDLRSEDG